jgi:hypothetical protein
MKNLSLALLLSIVSAPVIAMETPLATAATPAPETLELVTPGACCCPHDHEDEKSLEAGQLPQEIPAASAQQTAAPAAPTSGNPAAAPQTAVALAAASSLTGPSANPLSLELLKQAINAQTTISGTEIKETSYNPETQCAQINHEQIESYLNGILSGAHTSSEDKALAEQLLTKLRADDAKFACLAASLEHNMAAMHSSLLSSALEMALFQQEIQREMAHLSRARAPRFAIPTFWDLLF